MILARAGLRYLLHHPWLVGLSILGVALGVAVVVAIELANDSATRAFRLSTDTLTGRTTHQIIGGPKGVPESVYRRLRVELGFRQAAPVVEGYASSPQWPGLTFRWLGVDPLAEPPFRSYAAAGEASVDLGRLLTGPATALIAAETAAQAGISAGQTITLDAAARRHELTVVGVLDAPDPVTRRALATVVVTDLATAQELLGRVGYLSRTDLILPDRGDWPARIGAILPPGVSLVPAESRSNALVQMSRAFRLNLTALSLLALMVGMFLIYNTMTFSVIQRRTLIGTLRALGVTRRQVFALVSLEGLAIGGVGTALGIALGIVLAQGLVGLVTRTINDLYFVLTVTELSLAPWSLAKGVALGLGASVVSALMPAVEATQAPPRAVLSRSVIEGRTRRLVPRAAITGVAVLVLASAIFFWPTKNLVISFAALFAVVAGFALLVPALTVGLAAVIRAPMGWLFGLLGRMAARAVVVSLSRTGVAIAALAVAISATVGVGIMIGSFRVAVIDWLDNYLRADVFISSAGAGSGPGRTALAPEVMARIEALPGVEAVHRGRRVSLQTETGIVPLFAIQMRESGFARYRLKHGDLAAAKRAFFAGEGVLVSEPYAFRHALAVGDRLSLPTVRGVHDFTVAGVFYDYGSDQGLVVMDRATYQHYWDDGDVSALALFLAPGVDADHIVAAVRESTAGLQQLNVFSNRGLKQASIEVFDRTFAITEVLRLLAVVIAFVGVLSALMAIQLERSRELAVLRATGLTPPQVWGLVNAETGLMGLMAGVLSLPLGVSLAVILVLVINRRSFGWTMPLSIDAMVLVHALVLAIVAALLAGVYPAYKMARTSPALALREE